MNRELYTEVFKVLSVLEGLPYFKVRIILERAEDLLGKYSCLNLDNFINELNIEEEFEDGDE